MHLLWIIIGLMAAAIGSLGIVLVGALQNLAELKWRLDQHEALSPRRMGRDGLRIGAKAPRFTLSSSTGGTLSLCDHLDRTTLLVFVQAGCGPCRDVVPELNRLTRRGLLHVVAICRGSIETAGQWAAHVHARFPVLAEEESRCARRYEIMTTPFAFVIDGRGTIAAKGLILERQHIDFLLANADGASAPNESDHELESVASAIPA